MAQITRLADSEGRTIGYRVDKTELRIPEDTLPSHYFRQLRGLMNRLYEFLETIETETPNGNEAG